MARDRPGPGGGPVRSAGRRSQTGWAPTLDAWLLLERGRARGSAGDRLAVDLDDRSVGRVEGPALWRPWYAAAWAEAGVLARLSDGANGWAAAQEAAQDNPVAAALVRRAAALEAGDLETIEGSADVLDALGEPYRRLSAKTRENFILTLATPV